MSRMVLQILKQFLGQEHDHNESTGQVSFDCPACAEDKCLPYGRGDGKHKLSVNYSKNIFRCWVCGFKNGMHGYVPKLIKRYGNKKLLKEYFLVRPNSDDYKTEKKQIEVKLPEGFTKLIKDNDNQHEFYSAYNYIKNRGITDEMIDKFNIGYTVLGKYHNRIIIPSYDDFNDLNYFISRSWDKWKKPKYLNPIAEKTELVFNEKVINWDSTLYLVEGVFDHICIPNSIPLLGKILHDNLKNKIYEKANAEIVIVLDGEAFDDAIKIYKTLNIGKLKNKIKLCTPPYNEDPSSIFQKQGNKGIIKLLRASDIIPESKLY